MDGADRCTCDADYTLKNCEISLTDFNNIITAKSAILTQLEANMGHIYDKTVVFSILEDISQNSLLNTNSTMNSSKSILDSVIQLDNSSVILNEQQANSTANILDNMLSFSSENDCELSDTFTT